MDVIGTIALDTLARVPALPAPETTAGVRELHPDLPGGTGGNVATALARLGARPRLVAAVGRDFAGSAYERALLADGVDLSGLMRVDTPTSRAYVFVDGEGGQVTYFYAGASRALARAEPAVRGRAHFAAGEISCYPALMRTAEWVSFDPGQESFHRDPLEILACLPHVDLLFLNRHERAHLAAVTDLSLDDVFAQGVATIVETLGKDGALLHEPGKATRIPAVPARHVDPTGAGDAHRAGVLFALDRGLPLEEAARFGAVLGSFAVESLGPQGSLPTLEAALARHEKAFGGRPAL